MDQVKVSIIIPAYNVARYVRGAVESALGQTYRNKEIIVVDDGSEDGIRDALELYIASRRIVYVRQPNLGLAGARNTGVRMARGEFIALLDSDDAFLPEKVARQVGALLDNPAFGVCYSDILHFTETSPVKYYHHRYHQAYKTGDLLEDLLMRNFINPLSVVARKSTFEQFGFFDERLRRSEDWDLWLRWSSRGVKFYYLNQILGLYRIRKADNLTSLQSEPEMKEESLRLFSNIFKNSDLGERFSRGKNLIFSSLEQKAGIAYLLVGNKKNARKHLKKSLALRPSLATRGWLLAATILPNIFLKPILRRLRDAKHRLLLSPCRFSGVGEAWNGKYS